jgi:ribonuclease PH
MRADGRQDTQLRPIKITRRYLKSAMGSVMMEAGDTRVLCTAMLERDLPPWLKAKGPGAGRFYPGPGSDGFPGSLDGMRNGATSGESQ